MGAGATIVGGMNIGNNVTIATGAVVVKDIPDNATVGGVPAKLIHFNHSGKKLFILLIDMANLFSRIIGKLCHLSCSSYGCILPRRGSIYMLHDISDKKGDFCISAAELDHFLSSVDKSKVIDLADWESRNDFIAFTIDDVPESFFYNGFPLFKKYGMPFTLFVSTSLLDTPGFIKTEHLKEMAQCELCTIGSHGTLHGFYRKFDKNEKLRFLEESQKRLSEICNRSIDLFAFPYGSVYACGFKDKKLVSRFYKYGFGTVASDITKKSLLPKYFLPRINFTSENR